MERRSIVTLVTKDCLFFLIAAGHFSEGRLWLYEAGGTTPRVVPDGFSRSTLVSCKPGDTIRGEWHNAEWSQCPQGISFNGKYPHAVESYVGTRFSVVWYTVGTDRKVSTALRTLLCNLGFPLPPALDGPRGRRYGLYYAGSPDGWPRQVHTTLNSWPAYWRAGRDQLVGTRFNLFYICHFSLPHFPYLGQQA